jgi:hypothetical protein
MANWRDVRTGFVVKDKEGRDWTVTAREPGQVFTISAPGRGQFTGPFTGEVNVVSQPAPQNDPHIQEVVAKGLIATKFGGVEIGKQGKDKAQPWLTPVEFEEPGSMLAHLRIFHGASSDDPSLAGLRAFHATLHDPAVKVGELYEPHRHDPEYADR